MDIKLDAINLYPVKSLGGIERDRAQVTSRGIDRDRRWMLTDLEGRFLSQRTHPALALVKVNAKGAELQLTAPGRENLILTPPTGTARQMVTIWRDSVDAATGDDRAAAWFSSYLGQSCRLVYMDDHCRRQTAGPATTAKHLVSFADGYPCLITSTASLDLLNSKLAHPVPMDRFRANLVVTGCAPHQEDTWDKIQIGEAVFQGVKPCSRCQVPTIDQDTGRPAGDQEPLRTLATYRTQAGGVMFGMNLVVIKGGELRVGDSLEILS